MKFFVLVAVGFVIGFALAHFEKHRWPHAPSFSLPAIIDASKAVVAPAAPALNLPPKVNRPTLRATVGPVYQALFESLDDTKGFAVAIEESVAMEPLLIAAPRDPLGETARRLGVLMKGVRLETQRAAKLQAQPHSTALGGGQSAADFFDGIYDQRWRASIAALGKKAAPEWQRLIILDGDASYPPGFQSAIEKELADRHVRHLERTAILLVGNVTESLSQGALIRVGEDGDSVFVAGFPDVADGSGVRVLAHRDGVFKYTNSLREAKTVWKFRYYRDAD